MKCFYSLSLFSALLGYACSGFAQNRDTLLFEKPLLSNFREKIIPVLPDTFRLDTLSIIPSSLIIEYNNTIVPKSDFDIMDTKSLLAWKKKPPSDSVRISYRVFPYNFTQSFYHKDFRKIRKDSTDIFIPFIYSPEESSKSIFDFGGLNYNGSISRGIAFGNNQDLVVNSAFNLQMSGNLTKDIEVSAAITDENVPIQPEGNTQQIQEFDKVFIQFKKDNSTLIAGDYEIGRPESYFMNFTKKSQGASFKSIYKAGEKNKLQTQLSLAVAKGKYAKNVLPSEEGNQGPYKLVGANNETFIIVLAGTERVFIDGLLIDRGADRDYVIDYNTGEITFTPRRLITKDSRIIVEFEYSDKNYFRSLLYLNQEWTREKLKMKFNFYSEQDSRNQPVQQELTPEQRNVLERIGDDMDSAIVQGIDSIAFDASRVMYKKIDTTVYQTQLYTVFVYSANPDNAKYVLTFTYVGAGNGNYEIDNQVTVNGRVYKWVAPDSASGRKMGSYEPVIQLITPKQQQLYTLGIDYQFNKNNALKTEFALSNYDVNTFSAKGNSDNAGLAGMLSYRNVAPLKKDKPDDLTLHTEVNYEFINRAYQPIERNRSVEFERDWNLSGVTAKDDEHNGNISLNLVKNKLGNVKYGFGTFQKGENYEGYQHSWNSALDKKGFKMSASGSYLESTTLSSKTKFLRPKVDISKSFSRLKGWKAGVKGEQENNRYFPLDADTFMASSFKYNLYRVYITNADTAKVRWNADFTQRYDYAPDKNRFTESTLGNTFNLGGSMLKNPNSQLQWNATYRELLILDSAKAKGQKADEAILGRIEYGFVLWKGLLRSNSLYEVGSGREQKRQFSYVRVADGLGVYEWVDYNGDSIQQINEFEKAYYSDKASFLKIFNLTNEYIKTYSTQFNQLLDLSPKALWYDAAKGFKKFASRFSTQSALQISRKVINAPGVSPFNPLELNVDDTVLVSVNSNIRNSVYFNRSSPSYGIDLDLLDNRDKSVLTNGFESRQSSEQSVKARVNLTKKISSFMSYKQGLKISNSEYSKSNDYEVGYFEVEPRITFQPSASFRASFFYNYSENRNDELLGGQYGKNSKISAELKYNVVAKSTLNARASFAHVNYDYPANTPVAFAILQGLQAGDNLLWSVSYDRTIAANIQLSFIYDGRQTGESKVVHTGRAQVRAVF